MARIAMEVTTKDGYERNDSSVTCKVSNNGITPRSGVASPNHAAGHSMVSALAPAPARTAPTLPDEILEVIFLRSTKWPTSPGPPRSAPHSTVSPAATASSVASTPSTLHRSLEY
jgi:hypothetical protein